MIGWLQNRAPGRFKVVDAKQLQKLRTWLSQIETAPLQVFGEVAASAGERDDPSFSGSSEECWSWLAAEVNALRAIGESRVAANLARDGPGQTVDYYFRCGLDTESGAAQVSLHLCPRDRTIGEIIMLCEIMRTQKDHYVAWGSGLEHEGASGGGVES